MPAATTATKSVKKTAKKKSATKQKVAKQSNAKKSGTKKVAKKPATKAAAKKTGATGVTTPDHDRRVAEMVFSSFYPHYVTKVEKKGRTVAELNQVLRWLTGYTEKQLQKHIAGTTTVEQFFAKAKLNPKAELITGTICGYRIEAIRTRLTREARYMDKLVDELAKGRAMGKILREG